MDVWVCECDFMSTYVWRSEAYIRCLLLFFSILSLEIESLIEPEVIEPRLTGHVLIF